MFSVLKILEQLCSWIFFSAENMQGKSSLALQMGQIRYAYQILNYTFGTQSEIDARHKIFWYTYLIFRDSCQITFGTRNESGARSKVKNLEMWVVRLQNLKWWGSLQIFTFYSKFATRSKILRRVSNGKWNASFFLLHVPDLFSEKKYANFTKLMRVSN